MSDGRLQSDRPLVYLAGPYSKPDPVQNVNRVIQLADLVLDVCVPVIPHLTLTWHLVSPKPYEQWLELDLAVMRRCDVVFRFEGESSGADAEVADARAHGIPVVFSVYELRELLKDWVA